MPRVDLNWMPITTEIIRRRVQGLGWNVEKEVLPYLASLSTGTPRQALRLLSASYRVSRSGEEKTVSLTHAKRAVSMEGLDEKGLTVQEQSYLRALADGISRLGVISSRIAMPTSTVQRVVEPYLIRSGLISKDEGRRELTAAGREHVARILRALTSPRRCFPFEADRVSLPGFFRTLDDLYPVVHYCTVANSLREQSCASRAVVV